MYHGGPRVKKSTFFVVAGLTNLVWEKLEPLPRFSAVIEQKTDMYLDKNLTFFKFFFLRNGLKFIYSEEATKFSCTVVKSKGKILHNFVAFSE